MNFKITKECFDGINELFLENDDDSLESLISINREFFIETLIKYLNSPNQEIVLKILGKIFE